MIVLSWLNFHPGHTPEYIARGLRAEEDVDEIAKLYADLVAAGFIDPMTRHCGREPPHERGEKSRRRRVRGLGCRRPALC